MRSLPLLLLLAALLIAGLWWVDRPGDDATGVGEAIERAREETQEPPAPVALRGRTDARAAREKAPATQPEPAPPSLPGGVPPSQLEILRPLTPKGGGTPAPLRPRRPDRPDANLGDPWRSPRYRRVDLLGRPVDGTGPWLPDGRELVFAGMAKVDHEDAGAAIEEEIEEPLVTAVVGTIQSDGEPVPGALVILYSTFYQRHARYDHHVREVGRAITDGYGAFDLRPIGLDTVHFGGDGEVLLTAHREGYGSIVGRRLDNLRPEVENDLGAFDLQPVSPTLSGTILDLAGKPVVGAVVRVSGSVDPVLYDKTERMIILKDCPTAVSDEEGRYRLEGFAVGTQHVSVHVNIDCVRHFQAEYTAGDHTWSPRVLAGRSVRGRVVDADGVPVAAAVVSGGGNWTPSNADGTFWLDNIQPGPFTLHVAHHLFVSEYLPNVKAETDDLEVVMASPLPRIELFVTDEASGRPVALLSIDWVWLGGGPPPPFVPVSRYWHAENGRYDVVVPEGAVGARVQAEGLAPVELASVALEDGRVIEMALPTAE